MSQSKIKSSLSWLGVSAVIAGCMAAALVRGDTGAFAQTPSLTHAQTTPCRGAASGQVATSSRGQAQGWGAAALDTLCNGAETSTEPANCFNHTMTSNSVSWARGSTTWNPTNALRLCAGALDAGRRLNCFTNRIGNGTEWAAAIDQCIAEERTLNVQIAPSANAPRVTAPLQQGPATVEQIQAARSAARNTTANLICRAPLWVSAEAMTAFDATDGMRIDVRFQPAASRANIQPGQCWREGGWGVGGALMGEAGGGIGYVLMPGPCSVFTSLLMRDGALAQIRPLDGVALSLFNLGLAGAGEVSVPTRYHGIVDSGSSDGDRSTRYEAQRASNTMPPQCPPV